MDAALALFDVTVERRGKALVRDVSWRVGPGESWVLASCRGR